jgi:hypothetical protein
VSFGIVGNRQSKQESEDIQSQNELEISQLKNSNLVLEKEISWNKVETEKLKKERDSIINDIEKTKLKLKESDIKIEELKVQELVLKNRSDSLYIIANYEKTSRYLIENSLIENRKIYQFGPVINELEKFKHISVNISTIDNGEAINTRDRLITLFRFVGWKIKSNELFYDSEFEYLIPPNLRNKNMSSFEEGIEIIYYNNHSEIQNKRDSLLKHNLYDELNKLQQRSTSELVAERLKNHLLAMGVYASTGSAEFYGLNVKENEIYLIIGNKYQDEEQKVNEYLKWDKELKNLYDYYKSSNIQILNNKIIIE